jgi:hypothetical protein
MYFGLFKGQVEGVSEGFNQATSKRRQATCVLKGKNPQTLLRQQRKGHPLEICVHT